ncbi:protein STICHEL-like 2 [Cocos nucifera]|nr:protein STICHEL-like 2 [Cocos nucifera]
MSEARRHSVEIPLSKTLVALKRVRSLRDPATISMSKFATVVENISWQTNSCNGAALDLNNSDKQVVVHSGNLHLKEEIEDHGSNPESDHGSRIPRNRSTASKKSSVIKIRGLDPKRTKLIHKTRRDRPLKSQHSTWVEHSTNHVEEEVDSYREPDRELTKRVNATIVKKSCHGNLRKSSTALSRVGSPCMSLSEPRTNASRHSTLGRTTEETQIKSNDVVDSNFSGCGISYCWSGTPKYKDRNFSSDSEDQEQPLLSAEGTETAYRDAAPCPESPRSLSQKFRPRSFNELVGLNVVAQSLLHAISKGKVAPIYLFHGPRGTGKTSTARIFAAALNCLSFEDQKPCGFCRECIFVLSGRCRDVKELDAVKISHIARVKALVKSASLVPLSSRFKVFIIDECQSLGGEAWAAIFKSLDGLPRNAVYVMITSDLDDLPRNSISRCQRFHFPKIKDVDMVCRLQKICIEERLDFEKDALYFIAAKSNGSLRDAETMLDQLSLLGKRITVSLAYELVGVVSDDELLDLLDLALSSDTANTVRRARELMSSRVDPLQLVSQLANLIMDILAGKSQSGFSEVGRNFIGRHAFAEIGMQKLRHALKVLSETEKQLRASKNQSTWLTVALLQFNTGESSPLMEISDSQAYAKITSMRDDKVSSISSPRGSLKSSACYTCNNNKSNCLERECSRKKLENIWKEALTKCQSNSLKNFLHKAGYLSAVYVNEGLAIAEVEFCHPDHVSRAEKSQNLIANLLQHVLGCNVDIRVKLIPASMRRDAKWKKLSFSLLSCSGRKKENSDSAVSEDENETSAGRETSFKVYLSHHGQQLPPSIQQFDCKSLHDFHDTKAVTIRNAEGNAQSIETMASDRSVLDDLPTRCKLESDFSTEVGEEVPYVSIQEPETQPSCFSRTLKLQRKLFSSDGSHTICLRVQPHNKLELSVPKKGASETYFCTYDPYNLHSRSISQVTCNSGEDNLASEDSRFSSRLLCWRTPKAFH